MCQFCELTPGCDFCEGYVENNSSSSAWAVNGEKDYFCLDSTRALVHMRADGVDWSSFNILYCPMCGRKLDFKTIGEELQPNDGPTDEEILSNVKSLAALF